MTKETVMKIRLTIAALLVLATVIAALGAQYTNIVSIGNTQFYDLGAGLYRIPARVPTNYTVDG